MKQLLPTTLYAAEVPERSDFFAINRSGQLSFDPDYNTIEGGWRYIEGDYSQFRVLGTVTKDSISFDVTPFISRVINTLSDSPIYENYELPPKDGNYDSVYVSANSFTTATESFYSLLKDNGCEVSEKSKYLILKII